MICPIPFLATSDVPWWVAALSPRDTCEVSYALALILSSFTGTEDPRQKAAERDKDIQKEKGSKSRTMSRAEREVVWLIADAQSIVKRFPPPRSASPSSSDKDKQNSTALADADQGSRSDPAMESLKKLFPKKCWDCARGGLSKRHVGWSVCRVERGHTGPCWVDDPREHARKTRDRAKKRKLSIAREGPKSKILRWEGHEETSTRKWKIRRWQDKGNERTMRQDGEEEQEDSRQDIAVGRLNLHSGVRCALSFEVSLLIDQYFISRRKLPLHILIVVACASA